MFRFLVVLICVVVIASQLYLFNRLNTLAANAADKPPAVATSGPVERWFHDIYDTPEATAFHTFVKSAINVFAATVIGIAGASAFYVGVLTGFIDRTAREDLLLHLLDDDSRMPPARRSMLRLYYFFFGGVVAGVFQAAQADTLAPIQAFVLGITWPSVVSRSMSSGSTTGQTVRDALQLTAMVAGTDKPLPPALPGGPAPIAPTPPNAGPAAPPTSEVVIEPQGANNQDKPA